ncbi:MAG: outer membrane lipoprotein carrier protein LolA [Acidobacteriota bacterium]
MKSIFKSAFLAVMFISAAFVAEADAQGGELGKILRRMDTHNRNLTTLRANVTWAKENTQLGETDVVQGSIMYAKRPGKDALVRVDWKRPSETISVGDGRYVIFQPDNNIAYKGSVKDASKGQTKVASAFSFMSMSRAELDANFTPSYLGQGNLSDGTAVVHLRLIPKAKANFKSAELWVDVDGMLRQTKVVESNNDTSTFLITKAEKNPPLKSSDFNVKLPGNTKVQTT